MKLRSHVALGMERQFPRNGKHFPVSFHSPIIDKK